MLWVLYFWFWKLVVSQDLQRLTDFLPVRSQTFKLQVFFLSGFSSQTLHWRFTGQQRKGGNHLLFHSTTSTDSRTLRHLFATLHVRLLSRIFNRNACVYQADEIYHFIELPFEWLIDDAMFVCLLDELILGFC